MKQLNIPFKLGMQYDNWELSLEILQDRIRYYDSYIYLGSEFNLFFNFLIDKTELVFNWDILVGIIISINNTDLMHSEILQKLLEEILGTPKVALHHNTIIYKFTYPKEEIWSYYNDNIITIINAKEVLISKLTHSILSK